MQNQIARDMLSLMRKFNDTLDVQRQERETRFEQQRQDLVARQRAQRQALNDRLEQRQRAKCEERQKRFRTGFKGFWDRLTGQHNRTKTQNERAIYECFMRDRAEKDRLVFQHLEQRRNLNALRIQERAEHQHQKQDLQQDVQTYEGMLSDLRKQRLEDYSRERSSRPASSPLQDRNRGRSLER